ncbi:MAG: type II secretion system F family protein [Candidatus Omnitrophica bacterium]|nr:type II secretion system F family protein [Candidatus Omnitrophota bacterium]MCM8801999.1 type II secretion system F family protein [Candidatus Omnitrophota bacterium]
MAKFFYIARDFSGNKKEGVIEGDSTNKIITILRNQNLFPVEIKLIGQKGLDEVIEKKKKLEKRRRVSLGEISIFSRQLAVMLDAGVPIIDAISDLKEQSINKYFAYILDNIIKDIQTGSSFSNAISKYPKIFSPLYVALVRSGEESGNLSQIMTELSSYIEDQIILLRKLRQALSYPTVIFIFFIGVISFVFLFLIPKFESIFSSFGAKLPFLTLIIFKISGLFIKLFPFIILGLILFGIFLYFYKNTKIGRYQIDKVKLMFPFIGKIMVKISLARFSRSLSTLLSGGVSITNALEIVAKTSGNVIIENNINKIRKGVIEGKILNEEMKKHKIFPSILVRMVRVGEETGRLEDMLNRVSKFFKDEVDATMNILTTIIEPILIIGLGIVVGIVVLAIYLPIFKLAGTLR